LGLGALTVLTAPPPPENRRGKGTLKEL